MTLNVRNLDCIFYRYGNIAKMAEDITKGAKAVPH